MAASKIIDKISVGAIHSVDCAGSQLRFYKYTHPVAGSFRSRLPFAIFSLNNLRGVSIHESHFEYVTTFHYNIVSTSLHEKCAAEERIWWPFRYDNYHSRKFSEWREETDAQILNVLEIVGNAEMKNPANELK